MNVLVVGAHPDDFEIGMAGTIRKHVRHGDQIYAIIMSNGEKIGLKEIRKKEASKSAKFLGISEVFFFNLPDTSIPCNSQNIERVEKIIVKYNIARVYTHSLRDTHQDHLNTSRTVLAAARNVPQILFYESPSSDLDFRPTFFVDISPYLNDKIRSLNMYDSINKLKKRYLEIKAVRSNSFFRGYQSKMSCAESFEVYKFIEP
ncbi:MAG: PIG-L deacetylase family protein [Nanoarchaeota archaeon]